MVLKVRVLTDQVDVKVFIVDDASDERSKELRQRALHPVVADDHLDHQRVPGHDVVHLLDLVGHLLFESGLKYGKIWK